tara:strand:- start:131 stop:442 length:312 start_codon:yes stop_codon:yes gene_type:complete
MIKVLKLIFIALFLTSCQGTKEAFSLKKKNNEDEFLVEKKSPLVMPPEFGKLPLPEDNKTNSDLVKEDSIEDLISTDKNDVLTQKKSKSKETSIEKLILEKIN